VRTTIKRDGTREYSIAYYKNFGGKYKNFRSNYQVLQYSDNQIYSDITSLYIAVLPF
jgi:hypothetical protein